MDRLNELRVAHAAAQKRAQEALDAVLALADDAPADVVEAAEAEVAEAEGEAFRSKEAVAKREALLRSREAHQPDPAVPAAKPALAGGAIARGQLRSETTYRPDGRSFFADLRSAKEGDNESRERLVRNNHEYEVEKRAGLNQTATTAGEFVPPVWLEDQYAPKLRGMRPTVDAIGTKPWPPQTNSLNFPAITTGASTAAQSDGGAVSNTDWVTTSYTAQAQTVAGRSVASYQLLDLGWAGVDGVIYEDLIWSYATQFDTLVLNGAVTNAKGILNTTGINAVTYTTATPKAVDSTVANSAYYQFFLAKNAIEKSAFCPVDLCLVHPSFWNWFLTGLDTANRPISIANTGVQGFNATSAFDPGNAPTSPLQAGNVAGMPVVSDANIPVNLGGGTNESRLILLNKRGFDIYESTPRFKIADQTSITTLQYQFVLYNYYGVVSRQPKMVSAVSGTGMIVQSGF